MLHIWYERSVCFDIMYASHMVQTFCILRHNVYNVCTICEVYIMSRYTERVYHMWSIHYVKIYRTFVPYVKHTLCRSMQNVCTICEAYIMSKHTERLYHMWSIHYVEEYRTFVPYVKYTLCRSIQNVCTICEVYIMSRHTERLYHMCKHSVCLDIM
jgi:ribosome-associated toxin RatA of RatAB toxin-antitoxin module